MASSNPAFKTDYITRAPSVSDAEAMTIDGSVNKTFLLLAFLFATAYWAWMNCFPEGYQVGMAPTIPGWYWGAVIGGFVVALVIIFKNSWAPFLAPVYAILEGLFLGAISALMETQYPGIVIQAILGTAGTFMVMLTLYRTRIIKVTDKLRMIIVGATLGIALVYIIGIVMSFFGGGIPYIHESGPIGIGFSVVVCGIAAFNLLLDFDFIEKGSEAKAPKYMEWYAAFGLLVTLIWLYLEILRLLGKARD